MTVVRQLRLLFLQLYESEQSAVRPDEELAYLAITRPEVDAIVEPKITAFPNLDSIPDIPSPTSTRVATPTPSRPFTPDSPEIVETPLNSFDDQSSGSILGKRQSQDRDSFSDTSPAERARLKTDGFNLDELDKSHTLDGYEMINAESPSNVTDLADLSIGQKNPPDLTLAPDEDFIMYDPPSIPPPLPARPHGRRDSTLASGLRFGLQQDSAEVLINVLSQLELAFDPTVEEGQEPGRNLISE
jgi:ubiquitin carboxyl-terminal hydrolase 25/28